MSRPQVVILGGGFAGAYCALGLARRWSTTPVDVTLISPSDYLLFYPLLIEAGTGVIDVRHAVVSLRAFLGRQTTFRMGSVLGFDWAAQTVTYRLGKEGGREQVPFDHLVCAWGSTTQLPDIPGFAEYAYSMKSLTDAVIMRERAIEMLETADGIRDPAARREWLQFVVVGGNFTGVETAGELNSYIRHAAKRYRGVQQRDIRVTLINRTPRVLKELEPDLGEYAVQHMSRHGVEFRFGLTVKSISVDHVVLTDGSTLRTRTVLWCAGTAASDLGRRSGLPLDAQGYLLCEPDCRVVGQPNVWAVGDCAINPDPAGNNYPFTAQHAVREGAHAARNIQRVLTGKSSLPCVIQNMGSLAMIGYHSGVAKILRFKFSGRFAWFLYRTFYLLRMPGWVRKARIAADWTLDVILPRDQVQLGIRQTPRPVTPLPEDA